MALQSSTASVGTGLATGALAFMVYNASLPSVADVRAAEPENMDIMSAERGATWIAAGLVAGVALMTQDPTVFVIGGAVVVAMAWFYRHGNEVSPLSGKASLDIIPGGVQSAKPEEGTIYLDAPFGAAN